MYPDIYKSLCSSLYSYPYFNRTTIKAFVRIIKNKKIEQDINFYDFSFKYTTSSGNAIVYQIPSLEKQDIEEPVYFFYNNKFKKTRIVSEQLLIKIKRINDLLIVFDMRTKSDRYIFFSYDEKLYISSRMLDSKEFKYYFSHWDGTKPILPENLDVVDCIIYAKLIN